MKSPLHRTQSLDYGLILAGEFELSLDSGESKRLHPGDFIINRGCMQRWHNVSSSQSGRLLFVMLDIKPLVVNGKELKQDMADLSSDYADA